jgi:3D (Asp-Asp-Asp) domain-containing protein
MKNKKLIFKRLVSMIILIQVCAWGWRTIANPNPTSYTIPSDEEEEKQMIAEIVEDKLPELKLNPQKDMVVGTVYWPVASQCWGNPLITADGAKISLQKLQNGEIRWIAVSRDLLKRYRYGQKVYIEVPGNPNLNGVWEIHDTMNKRFTSRIDFLQPQKGGEYGKWSNISIQEVWD